MLARMTRVPRSRMSWTFGPYSSVYRVLTPPKAPDLSVRSLGAGSSSLPGEIIRLSGRQRSFATSRGRSASLLTKGVWARYAQRATTIDQPTRKKIPQASTRDHVHQRKRAFATLAAPELGRLSSGAHRRRSASPGVVNALVPRQQRCRDQRAPRAAGRHRGVSRSTGPASREVRSAAQADRRRERA